MTDLDLTNDIIDVRDIIERIENIEQELESNDDNEKGMCIDADLINERQSLLNIMSDLSTCGGGDEQWRGDWYPITLIADSYFTDYAQELAEDCGMVNDNASWPNNCIDWNKAARELRMDYTPVTINGFTYWTR